MNPIGPRLRKNRHTSFMFLAGGIFQTEPRGICHPHSYWRHSTYRRDKTVATPLAELNATPTYLAGGAFLCWLLDFIGEGGISAIDGGSMPSQAFASSIEKKARVCQWTSAVLAAVAYRRTRECSFRVLMTNAVLLSPRFKGIPVCQRLFRRGGTSFLRPKSSGGSDCSVL